MRVAICRNDAQRASAVARVRSVAVGMHTSLEPGWELLRVRRPQQAAAVALEHLRGHPECVTARCLLAYAQNRLGRREEGIATAREALAIDPASTDALRALASLLVDHRDPAALEVAQQFVSQAPEDDSAHMLVAEALARSGRVDEGLASINTAISLAVHDPDLRERRAWMLVQKGRHKDALRDLDAALTMAPNSVYALVLRGDVLVALRRRREALGCYLAALRLDPGQQRVVDVARTTMLRSRWWLRLLRFGSRVAVETMLVIAVVGIPVVLANSEDSKGWRGEPILALVGAVFCMLVPAVDLLTLTVDGAATLLAIRRRLAIATVGVGVVVVLLSLAHLQWRLVVLQWTMRAAAVVFVALMFARWWHRRRRHA